MLIIKVGPSPQFHIVKCSLLEKTRHGRDIEFDHTLQHDSCCALSAADSRHGIHAYAFGVSGRLQAACKYTALLQGTAEEDILHGTSNSGGGGANGSGPQKSAGDARRTRNALFRALHRAEGVRNSAVVV
jgi:hypothetical protein